MDGGVEEVESDAERRASRRRARRVHLRAAVAAGAVTLAALQLP